MLPSPMNPNVDSSAVDKLRFTLPCTRRSYHTRRTDSPARTRGRRNAKARLIVALDMRGTKGGAGKRPAQAAESSVSASRTRSSTQFAIE